MKIKFLIGKSIIFAAALLLYLAPAGHAADIWHITVNESQYHYIGNIVRIAVGDTETADVHVLPSQSDFLLVGKKQGQTSLLIWTGAREPQVYQVVVSGEDRGLSRLIEEAIGIPTVHVKAVGKRVLLTGIVENQYERNYAIQTARLYTGQGSESSISVGSGFDLTLSTQSSTSDSSNEDIGDNTVASDGDIIDLLQMRHPTRIRLEAQIVDISSEDAKQLGNQFGTSASDAGIFYMGESYARSNSSTQFRNNPAKWVGEHFSSINAMVQALVTNGKANILSRPSISTMSGEEATIQVGGQIPYSTVDNNGNYNTSFKDYGVILQMKPVVDADNRIVSAVHTEVSEPSGETVRGEPALSTRRADSVVSVTPGTSMVIGGLMNSTERKTITKFPFLGNIPIIGEFFRHTSKTKDKRELIIIITPRIIDDEQQSVARMSDRMESSYRQIQKDDAALNEVDLNEEAASDDDDEQTEKSLPETKTIDTTDSILDQFLDRSVLPKTNSSAR